MVAGCPVKNATYFNEDKTYRTCSDHAEDDMKNRDSGRSKKETRAWKSYTRSDTKCMIAGCLNVCYYFTIDRKSFACSDHGRRDMWFYSRPGILARCKVASTEPRPDHKSSPESKREPHESKEGKTERKAGVCNGCRNETAEGVSKCASCDPPSPPRFEQTATEDTAEDMLVRALMSREPDLRIETTSGVLATQYDLVGFQLGLPLSAKGGSISVPYSREVVSPIVSWFFKEKWLQLDSQPFERVIQMLNFISGYQVPRLHTLLRARLTGEYKDLSHAKSLTACEDTVIQKFVCRKIADARIALAKAAGTVKCLNSPPQKKEATARYTCVANVTSAD
jgi:hypothetical protein